MKNAAMTAKTKLSAVLLATLFAGGAQAACYTVMGPKGQILSQSATPPVDMSYQLHQTVPYKYGPGATLVFGIADPNCGPELDAYDDLTPTQVAARGAPGGRTRAVRAPRRDRE